MSKQHACTASMPLDHLMIRLLQAELHDVPMERPLYGVITALWLYEGIQVDIGAQWDGWVTQLLAAACTCKLRLLLVGCQPAAAYCMCSLISII